MKNINQSVMQLLGQLLYSEFLPTHFHNIQVFVFCYIITVSLLLWSWNEDFYPI